MPFIGFISGEIRPECQKGFLMVHWLISCPSDKTLERMGNKRILWQFNVKGPGKKVCSDQ